MTQCPIADVEAIPLAADRADSDDLDGSSETILVRITDEEGPRRDRRG